MVGSALAALAQDDIKRVLAYSTIGQLGYMAGALAVGDRGAAVFHLLSHGAFKALLFLAAGVIIHAAGTNSLAAMSRMSGLAKRVPDAYWTMTVALLALAAIPPFSRLLLQGSRPRRRRARRLRRTPQRAPAAAGWIVLVAGLLTALLTAAYATRLWLLAFRGQGAETPDHGRQPAAMNAVLWVLAVPALAFGLAFGALPDWFDGDALTPPSPPPSSAPGSPSSAASSPTGPGGTPPRWPPAPRRRRRRPPRRRTRASRPRPSPPTPRLRRHRRRPDPADPGRLLLGPLHRHAAAGFHLDALLHRAVRTAPSRPPPASSASSTARSSTPTYAARAPYPACSAPPYGARRPAMCRPTSSALLAGSARPGGRRRPRRQPEREP